MGGNLEALAAAFAGDIGVYTHEVIFDLREHGARPLVGSARRLRLPRPPQPANGILVGAPAAGALEPVGPLLRFLGEELSFVHEPILGLINWGLLWPSRRVRLFRPNCPSFHSDERSPFR